MIKVSIIVTVYNVEKYIDRCIKSILQQSYGCYELLVVNDGTPDNSMSIVESYKKQDDRIRIIDYNDNVGLMWARRRGYLEAKGDYVFFVDSDDRIPPKSLETLVRNAEGSGVDIIAGQSLKCYENGSTKIIKTSLPYGNDRIGLYKALTSFSFPHYIWGKLIKKELLQDYNYVYFDKLTNGEDYALMYQIASNIHSVECVGDVVYYYTHNPESSSQKKLSQWQMECNIMVYINIWKMLIKDSQVRMLIYPSTQRAIARYYANGYNHDGSLSMLLNKYNGTDLLSLYNIFRYNNLFEALICIMGKSRLGGILFRLLRQISS